ncbi:MAG: bifunctional oligoribonuclease/PAP phosphatase NrnA [Candidatus Omnitrophota bacterium]
MSIKKAVDCIKNNKRFLITSHLRLEGDALGSELAFYSLLKALGKDAVIVNDDDSPGEYAFLPGVERIRKFSDNLKDVDFDVFAILDCSDLKRCGRVYKMNKDNKPILNIDHHISNEKFADVNWVEPCASSCAEVIYKLFKKLRLPFNHDTAMALYVGMLTDTGVFHYANTSSLTHKAVSELLKYDLDICEVYKNLYENKPFADMKLLSKILTRIKRDNSGRIAWFQLKQADVRGTDISFDLSERLLSFARAIKDIEVAVLFREASGKKSEVRVNLRSQGKIDVNRIANFFGGGGHKNASGCTVKGKINQVRKKVLAKIKEGL